MDDCGESVQFEVSAYVDTDIQVNDHGLLQIVLNMFVPADDDTPNEVRIDFYNITESILAHHKDSGEYQSLFSIAEEMAREAERIRCEAVRMSGNEEAVADLFNI
jgi:hypothetical protein|tara:strand:+ start:365 stop:679 length:315 start_codon:yes stop_codon:yes gene_type:complete